MDEPSTDRIVHDVTTSVMIDVTGSVISAR